MRHAIINANIQNLQNSVYKANKTFSNVNQEGGTEQIVL